MIIEMTAVKPKINLRTIALPAEHGSWGFVFEPILLGLLVAPSWAGASIALGMFGLFLWRWPFKIFTLSRRQKRQARMQMALKVTAVYTLIALIGFALAIWQVGLSPLYPLFFALPFALAFLWYDYHSQSRSWQAELTGPMVFGATAMCIALAGEVAFRPALFLWLVMIARSVPSVLYVRARIRLEHGKPFQANLVRVAHFCALSLVTGLAANGFWSFWVAGIFVLLWGRAVVGLSEYRRHVSVPIIGVSEIGWGLLVILTVALLP